MFLKKKLAAIGLGVKTLIVLVVGLSFAATAPSAKAAFILYLQQVGPDVVTTGSGTINTAGLTLGGEIAAAAKLTPTSAVVIGGPTTPTVETSFAGATGPGSFGSGAATLATSGSGDSVGVLGGLGVVEFRLPSGYVSGAALLDTDTYANQTLATLGFTPGTYTYTFGSGATADSFVVTSVPEPTSLGLLSLGLVLLQRRRRNAAANLRA